MKIVTMDTVVGKLNIRIADSFFYRLKGLLFTTELHKSDCILIAPCGSVHTIGMRYPIHIVFLSIDNKILDVRLSVKPNRFCLGPTSTKKVVELSPDFDLSHLQIIGKKFLESAL